MRPMCLASGSLYQTPKLASFLGLAFYFIASSVFLVCQGCYSGAEITRVFAVSEIKDLQVISSDCKGFRCIFRGSDIKDLQVKSSPPAQTTSQMHSDPAIISLQPQYSQPSQASNAFGPAASGSLPDLGSHGAHSGVLASPIRGALCHLSHLR
jgi:hypothetical protein